ncbi:MAG: rubredoxin [Coriobacteriales bacterium]|nr:rubredoxin [Coriobacteriales bacterium]
MAEGAATTKWKCKICGYEVEVEGDALPEDFKCPICGQGPDMFEKIEG